MQERLRAEVRSLIGDDIDALDFSKVKELHAMSNFLKEVLRMTTPAATQLPRAVIKDHTLGDKLEIKKG